MSKLSDLFGGRPRTRTEVILGVGAIDYETAKRLSEDIDEAQGRIILDYIEKTGKYDMTQEEIDKVISERWGK